MTGAVATSGRPVGMGASLGGLAMMHAATSYPGTFSGVFSQSGSFFRPRTDGMERGFRHYDRIVRFVDDLDVDPQRLADLRVSMTCGTGEENLANNRSVAQRLARLGMPVALVENPDGHNYTGWRDCLDPSLRRLLRAAVGPDGQPARPLIPRGLQRPRLTHQTASMRRDEWQVWSPTLGTSGHVMAYGHWGVPVLHFPSEGGSARDIEDNGIIHVLAPAIEAGRIKVYAVDANDHASWSNNSLPTEERARRHEAYHAWITDQVAPAIHGDCGGWVPIVTAGASMGAFHAVNLALRRADLFPHAVGMSGNYDPSSWNGWGEPGEALYFNNPARVRAQPPRRPPGLAARPGVHPARRGHRRVRGAPDLGAALLLVPGPGALGQGDPVRPRRLGPRHPP